MGATACVRVSSVDFRGNDQALLMFSVVIPLYNKAHTIVATLESVLSQQFQDFEVIIVDDGSTDGGSEKIQRYFDDPRILVVHQNNQGVSAARNRGVAASRYELIAFLDADDFWLPGYLAAMKAAVDEFPDAGVYCCGGVVRYPDASGSIRYSARHRDSNQEINWLSGLHFFANCSSVVIRKSSFWLVGGFPVGVAHGEDTVLFIKLALLEMALLTKAVFCPALLTVYTKGVEGQATADGGISHEVFIKRTNLVYAFSADLELGKSASVLNDFMLRALRTEFLLLLITNNYPMITQFFERINPQLMSRIGAIEEFLYRNPHARGPAIAWICMIKLIERLGTGRRYLRPKYKKRLPLSHLTPFCTPPLSS